MYLDELYKVAGNYLLNDKGIELQYIYTKIAFKIIEKFLELNKKVLTGYDSFFCLRR